jgi:hypothetical protein
MKRIPALCLVVLVLAVVGLQAQQTMILKVKVQAANIRSEPDMVASVVKQVKIGTMLEARQKIGEWYEVSITDDKGVAISGYINAGVVDVVGAGGGAKPTQQGGQQAEVKKGGETGAPTIIIQQQVQQNQANTQTNIQTQTVPEGTGAKGGAGGFKVLGGYSLANLKYDLTADMQEFDKYRKSRSGLCGGIGIEFGGQLGFEIDVLYLQKGVVFDGTYTDPNTQQTATFNFSMNLDVVSVPVLLKFNILDDSKGLGVFVLGGGEIAYIFQAKGKYTITAPDSTGKSVTQTGTEDIKENLNQVDYGLVVGGGISLPLGKTRLVIEGRYHLGMANLQKSLENEQNVDLGETQFKPKTTVIVLAAGFKF